MSDLQIFLHPLVIMQIADYHARKAVEDEKFNPDDQPRVVGAVMGVQTDAGVEILSSVEIEYELTEEKEMRFSDEFFLEDCDLYKQIYPEHEVLGWYSTAPHVYDDDINFHKLMAEYSGSPLYIRMDPTMSRDQKALAVHVYQQQLVVINDAPKQVLVEIPFKVSSEPAERLTIDHIIQNREEAVPGSQIVPTLATLNEAVVSLQRRVKFIIQYLDDVENGRVPMNQSVLREVQAICNRLPAMQGQIFEDEFFGEMSNAMFITYLGSMTKAIGQVGNTMDLFETMMEGKNSGMPRGGRGMRLMEAGLGGFGGMMGGFGRFGGMLG